MLLYPRLPSIRKFETNLKKIKFPLSFRICLSEQDDNSASYKKLGYADDFDFFFGKSRYNNSLFGWNGHTKDGGTIESTEGQYYLLIVFGEFHIKIFNNHTQGCI